MAVNGGARTLLLELSEDDIRRIVANDGGLCASWAIATRVSSEDLARGKNRAVRAVLTAMRREPRVFIKTLAEFCAPFLEAMTTVAGTEADDPLAQAVRRFAGIAGSTMTKLCISCIVEIDLPMSPEVGHRLQEFLVLADDPLTMSHDELADGPAKELPREATSRNEPVASVPTIPELLDHVRSLRTEGAELVSMLRAAVDSIERGEPVVNLDGKPEQWSAQVRGLLEDAQVVTAASGNLDTLEDALRTLRDEEQTRRADAQKAVDTVAYLRAQGLDVVVPGALAELGFDSLQHAEALLGTEESAATDQDHHRQLHDRFEQPDAPAGDELDDDQEADAIATELATAAGDPPQCSAVEDAVKPAAGFTAPSLPESVATDVSAGPSIAPLLSSDLTGAVGPVEATHTQHEPATTEGQQLEAPDTATPCVDTLPEQPWDLGSGANPPLIAELLLRGQFALAYHVGTASPRVTTQQRLLLRLTCAAARCSSTALEPVLPQLLPNDYEVESFDTDEVRVLLAASLRAGLRLGYAPLGLQALIDRAELGEAGLEPVMQALASTVQRGRTRETTAAPGNGEELAGRWAELADETQRLKVLLGRKNLIWGRASKVLRHLLRDGEPLGGALGTATELCSRGIDGASAAKWDDIESLGHDLRDQSKRDRMITTAHRAVSTGPQKREVIEAGARMQLHDNLIMAGELLGRLETVRRAILNADDIKGVESAEHLDRAMADAPPNLVARTVGDAALISLIEWRRRRASEPLSESLEAVLDRELLGAYELPRDVNGRPTRIATPEEVALLLERRPTPDIVAGHLAKGDLAAAREFIAELDLEGQFDDDLLRAARDGQQTHDIALSDAELGAARLRSLYKDELARELSGEIDAVRIPTKDRFDLSISALNAITARADNELESLHADLLARTAATSATDADKARIIDLIERRDETLAVEFLTKIESGQQLPEVNAERGDDFHEFFPAVVDIANEAQLQNENPLTAARAALTGHGVEPEDRQLKDGLRGWNGIKQDKRRDLHVFRARVAEVLRMIGLVPRTSDWIREISRTQRSGYVTYRVWASPVDRSYVPQLGTQAHTYDVTFVWDRATPHRLMDFIDERNRATQPNVIFYFGVLSARDRAQLRMLTLPGRGKGFSPLVIDEAVIAWLTTRQEPGWRFTQRVTLPFTTINPYSPFAGGEVPDEVFVGRDGERRRIESETDSMFVYGGRQLGKSALLRRVERLFNQSAHSTGESSVRSGNVAVYIDLKAAGIGEARQPAELWPLLGARLKQAGVIPAKGTRASTAEDVTAQITLWLDTASENRLLILLDEADNFLTVDANTGDSSTRGAFPVLQALKGVMASSNRRFKVIFAGLHQVQRFHDSSNTPVAHGGSDILIGPLESRDAYSLVVDPMNALGYSFANSELVWRLLLVTNYQASLVQIVCEALVRHLQSRPLPADGGRILIENSDIRAVCEEEAVQQLIAQRFRWTINLDSRYRVIALVVALRSRAVNEPAAAFSVDDLRDYCEYFWHVGFSRDLFSRKEFERYLAEMVGLGVLHRQGDRYGLRSPNIIRMLGSQQSLEQELQDAEQHLDPAYEYNPSMARQIMGDSAGFWMPRSPLTDHDLARLLNDEDGESIQIVCGSEALAIERVSAVIASAAREREFRCIEAKGPDIPELNQHHFGKRTHLVVDLSAATDDIDVSALAGVLQHRRNLSATIIVGPRFRPWSHDWQVPVHYLRRWSVNELRAWYESPFDSPLLRQRLFRVTSGWPKLIEQAMRAVRDGKSAETVLDELTEFLAQPEVDEVMLTTTGIDREVATHWATWFTTPLADGLTGSQSVPLADLSEALGRDAEPDLEALDSLDLVTSDDEGWVLDRVVIAAAERCL